MDTPPVISGNRARIDNILRDEPGIFEIKRNGAVQAEDHAPALNNPRYLFNDLLKDWFGGHDAGLSAINNYQLQIAYASEQTGTEVPLLEAIIYIEQSQNPDVPITFGLNDTFYPANINPELWAGLLSDTTQTPNIDIMRDRQANILAAARLLRELDERVPVDPDDSPTDRIAKIASLYGNTAVEEVIPYGVAVAEIYEQIVEYPEAFRTSYEASQPSLPTAPPRRCARARQGCMR